MTERASTLPPMALPGSSILPPDIKARFEKGKALISGEFSVKARCLMFSGAEMGFRRGGYKNTDIAAQ